MNDDPSLRLAFDPGLPISAHVDRIAELIRDHPVVVVAGETGSGKTTQLPKIAMLAGRQRIGHTQPRRIAARSVAERIAQEMGTGLGDVVGYQVRFTKQASRATRVKVMTDGILLNEITHDRDLRDYDTIIIDEAHERSLNIDFLLGCLKQLLGRRSDLRVIITSATIDTQRFAAHFDDAPIVEVSGRTYPVEVRYREPVDELGEPIDQPEAIVEAVQELRAEGPGDILVFCSGEREINDAMDALSDARWSDTEIVPLHARLSASEQHRIFTAHRGRRIVVATNIAETSLTVPGIRYVVDSGTARISRYSARTKVQRLPIEPISQASANQRSGRCGRVAPGIAIRLYSQEDFDQRPEFTTPEILRTNLASVILQMARARLGEITDFPFIEAPDRAQIGDGLRLLTELGALTSTKPVRLSRIGHDLAQMPVDPRLARMLAEANRRGVLREVLVIASFLAIQDPRERPAEHREAADAAHARFVSDEALTAGAHVVTATRQTTDRTTTPATAPLRHTPHTSKIARLAGRSGQQQRPAADPGGDIIAVVRLWRYLQKQRKALSGNQFRKLCREEYLNYLRIREWQDLHTQLKAVCKDLSMKRNSQPGDADQVLISVLSGLLSHVGLKLPTPARQAGQRRRPMIEYQGTRGARFAIQPGSSLARRGPDLVMAVELVETSRLWARTVAEIQPEWIEEVGSHLVRRQHSAPHWSSNSASVVSCEKVSLLGIPIIADRLVDHARVNMAEAREIFIRTGLVEGQWNPDRSRVDHSFLAHNAKVVADLAEVADRVRSHTVQVDDQDVFDFYDARIPDHVSSQASFDAWWGPYPDKGFLEFDLDQIADTDDVDQARSRFPDRWRIGELNLPVSYVFEPGHGRDGVTVRVPLAQLNQLAAEPFSWQVPGLRRELAVELIRHLPKSIRTSFVPAPDWATRAMDWLASHDADRSRRFCDELGRALTALSGVVIPADAWAPGEVPTHLQVGFEITSPGKPARYTRDLGQSRTDLSEQVTRTITRAAPRVADATTWAFGTLESRVEIRRLGVTAVGHPALVDRGDCVGVVMAETPEAAATCHRGGLRRLLVLTNPDPTRWTVAHLTAAEKLALATSPYASVPDLLVDARLKAAEQAMTRFVDPMTVRDEPSFQRLALEVRQMQADQMRHVVSVAARVCERAREARTAIAASPIATELTDQLDNLVFKGFISWIRDPWYDQLPRYIEAITRRAEAARVDPGRDTRLVAPIDDLLDSWDELCAAQPPGRLPDAVDDIAFMIEELRVQTFAQMLGTSITVSAKRIRKAMAAL